MAIRRLGRTDPEEQLQMVKLREEGLNFKEIARKMGRTPETVARVVNEYVPTAQLAKRYLRAHALDLAKRVVSEASVSEAIDVLSRPGIEALEPHKGQGQGGLGVYLSITQQSLGALAPAPGEVVHALEITGPAPMDVGQPSHNGTSVGGRDALGPTAESRSESRA